MSKTSEAKATTALQEKIKGLPVEFAHTKLGAYGIGNGTQYAWARVEIKQDKVVVYPITTNSGCRETACGYMSEARVNHNHSVEADGKYKTYRLSAHMGPDKPFVMVLLGHDPEKIKAGLRVVHHYEAVARCGERTEVYPVSHELSGQEYAAGRYKIMPYKGKITLVVGPVFWGQAIPFASVYLLLLRLINKTTPTPEQTVHKYMALCKSQGFTERSDYTHVRKLYGQDGYVMDAIVRHWRSLAKTIDKWELYQGHIGARRIQTAAENAMDKSKTRKAIQANAQKNVGAMHWKFAIRLAEHLKRKKHASSR